jgi:tetratricopeptide (TPR) repeat protein
VSAHAEATAGRNFLPPDQADFTGRSDEVDTLLRLAGDGGVCGIVGMAGVGKTALAVHTAHLLTGRFPDAQLFVDLHGYSEGYLPIDPAAAIGALLAELGVPGHRVPDRLDERIELWREELAGRRLLVVVDNAADAGHVRPLLPDGPGCLLLVTSRRGLDAVRTLELDVLPEHAALALFARASGLPSTDPGAVEVVRLCGHLPVAVRIAAARLRHSPAWTASRLAERLRDEHRRLTELASTDRSLVASFVLSHRQLAALPRRLFRLLGLVPGPDVDLYAAAALTGAPAAEVRPALEDLVDAHLLLRRGAGRYTFHDLLRAHAGRTARLEETETSRHAATTRLLDYYLHTAAAAADQIMRNRRAGTIDVTTEPVHVPAITDHDSAVEWLLAERVNLMAAINHAAHHDWPTHAWQLAHALWWFLHLRGYTTDLVATQSVALAAVHANSVTADRRGEATVLTNLGGAFAQSGLPSEAVSLLERALGLHRAGGDRHSEAATLLNLSGAYYRLGANSSAIDRADQARQVYADLGDRWGEVTALNNAGIAYNQAGEAEGGLARLGEALAIREHLGEAPGLARTLSNYGWSLVLLDRADEALPWLREALRLNRRSGSRWDEGSILSDMGVAHARLAEFDAAFDCHREALAMIRPMGQRGIEGELRNRAGQSYRLAGRFDVALDHYGRALTLATQAGERYHQAHALDGAAHCHLALGRADQARDHWLRALAVLTDLGHRDAATVRAALADDP